ncbi:Gfo/Idh/MocA family protein [Gayadomonas joobiniege]|uniref:Gfo/Idh/MocA family protein n=1 Tax=Gayadomonas joobiniege TaxID=1234606 RepID=UPI00037C1EE8|nr:Gfo/Idh/MocA family oxidoreductase [Gayadomonas joobiniege]
MQTIKLGVIGLGNIARQHIQNILSGAVKNCHLVAVCSRSVNSSEYPDVEHFNDYKQMIDSGLIDSVLIASPTFAHFEMAQYALNKQMHLMLEKPIGLSSYEGELLLKLKTDNVQFALMLNQRTDPVYQKMHQLVQSNQFGAITRTHWTMTNWFRPDIYFQTSDWRATWKGEGGGLLVNQCIHNLDIFQWICGVPNSIIAQCGFGKYHNIEVEDEATAFFNYENGATGVFVGSTGEAPGVNRFDIICEKGSLHFDSGQLTIVENDQTTAEFCYQTDEMFGMPQNQTYQWQPPTEKVNQHAVVMNNFVAAILTGEKLIAPAEEGLASLDIANGILLSSWLDAKVVLPLDRTVYQAELDKKIAASSFRNKSNAEVKIDMNASYR